MCVKCKNPIYCGCCFFCTAHQMGAYLNRKYQRFLEESKDKNNGQNLPVLQTRTQDKAVSNPLPEITVEDFPNAVISEGEDTGVDSESTGLQEEDRQIVD